MPTVEPAHRKLLSAPLSPTSALLDYHCNICGSSNTCASHELTREANTCTGCGSSVRLRAMVHLLSEALFGESLALDAFPYRPDIIGFGLSDWSEYARRLVTRCCYINTFYHTAPRLDITDIPDSLAGKADFLIATDVFEHVLSPVSRAFGGARKLLRDGAVFVFSVPFRTDVSETTEHFPELGDFHVGIGEDGVHRLHNRLADGRTETFEDLVFHGGPGSTLEMRIFSAQSLTRHFREAGFSEVAFADQPVPQWGIVWQGSASIPMVARA